jgi:nicotinamide-nucleotide amidase
MEGKINAEIFIIGNEILIGDIQDTNTSWLCKEISNLGGFIARATALRDDAEIIATEIKAAMKRGPRVIFTSGGLGPTADDFTLSGVARGVGVEIQLHKQALLMIKERYEEMVAKGMLSQGGLNQAREKMAWLPVGAIPLHNPVGTACGVMLKKRNSTIVSLPGIPSELKSIFTTSLQPFLRETFGGGMSEVRTVNVQCNDETLIEPVMRRVTDAHPRVYIKSLAKTCGAPELRITFTCAGNDRSELESLVGDALDDLREGLSSMGVSCRLNSMEQ